MNTIEKRDFIHRHLHQVQEPILNDFYEKMVSLINESLMEESEDDIKNGNLIPHESFKKEVLNWRPTK